MWGGLGKYGFPAKTPVKAEGVTVNAWSYDWVDPVVSLQDGYKLINTCDLISISFRQQVTIGFPRSPVDL